MIDTDILRGAKNLLTECGELNAGDRLLVLFEDAALGFYDSAIVDAVLAAAQSLGIAAQSEQIPYSPTATDPTPDLLVRMKAVDRVLFLARTGDQIRFRPALGDIRPIVSYALDGGMLASSFGRTDHNALIKLKNAVNSNLKNARHIRVTCPLGTDFTGPFANFPPKTADVTVSRFPMSVFTPVPADNFSGKIAQRGFLTGTGSQYYHPYGCRLEGVLEVHFEGNKIAGFDGLPVDVRAATHHYDFVGDLFEIDARFVHSWHAGIHPGCDYKQPAGENFERWSGGAFGKPRLLHFHTCGAYPPGEISLNILDPTISVDGVNYWDNRVFHPKRMAQGPDLFKEFPVLNALFDTPSQNCGLGPNGHLSFD